MAQRQRQHCPEEEQEKERLESDSRNKSLQKMKNLVQVRLSAISRAHTDFLTPATCTFNILCSPVVITGTEKRILKLSECLFCPWPTAQVKTYSLSQAQMCFQTPNGTLLVLFCCCIARNCMEHNMLFKLLSNSIAQ